MKVIGLVGASGSGKTTLIAQLLPLLRRQGLRVSTIKHAHHGFDLDRPGKDSFIHREAGAAEVMIVSGTRWALLHECPAADDLSLRALLRRLAPVDLVLVEGFRQEHLPKIEVHRPSLGQPPYFPAHPDIVAVAGDTPVETGGRVFLALSDLPAIARFVLSAAVAVD